MRYFPNWKRRCSEYVVARTVASAEICSGVDEDVDTVPSDCTTPHDEASILQIDGEILFCLNATPVNVQTPGPIVIMVLAVFDNSPPVMWNAALTPPKPPPRAPIFMFRMLVFVRTA